MLYLCIRTHHPRGKGNGDFLITHSSTKDKIRDIKKIAKAFNIKLKVEAVDKYAKGRIGVRDLGI